MSQGRGVGATYQRHPTPDIALFQYNGGVTVPDDYENYFKSGQPIYRGERRIVPPGVTTPQQMVDHMFPKGTGEIGKSWTVNHFVADHFRRQDSMPWHFAEQASKKYGMSVPEAMGNMAKVTFHSNVTPTDVSYDDGQITDASGKVDNWGPGWKHRVGRLAPEGSSLRRGDMGEGELIMKNDTQLPVHGMTMYFGSAMNHHQFEQPLSGITKYRRAP